MPQGTGGMGTGSDVRIYNPRSESSHMFRNNHEEDTYGLESELVRDKKYEKKLREKEKTKKIIDKVKHIKVTPKDLLAFEEQDEEESDDSEKIDADRELHAQTGPVGNLGALTSLAGQARGPGFAGGHAFAMGESMDLSRRFLKASDAEGESRPHALMPWSELQMKLGQRSPNYPFPPTHDEVSEEGQEENEKELFDLIDELELRRIESGGGGKDLDIFSDASDAPEPYHGPWDINPVGQGNIFDWAVTPHLPAPPSTHERRPPESFNYPYSHRYNEHTPPPPPPPPPPRADYNETPLAPDDVAFDEDWQDKLTGEPMDLSWQLLKHEKSEKRKKKDRRDRRQTEKRREWRPSTSKFKYGPGGTLGPKGATTRRHKARMRSVKRGRLTGMMDAPKAVEMEHRGISVIHPKSKDPGPYKEFLGQQESRRRLGNVRSPTASQFRYGARKYYSGKTGGGRLQGMGDLSVKKPRLHPVRMPKIVPPRMPTMPHFLQPQTAGPGAVPATPTASPPMMSGVPDEPSMVATGEFGEGSDLQKMKLGYYEITELRQLINQAKRALQRKEKKKKAIGTSDTGGAGTSHSRHKQSSHINETTRPEGPTEDAQNDPRKFGIVGVKGGRTP